MTEGDSFRTSLSTTFAVPAGASSISFDYANLQFDTTDTTFINDAFEVALLDSEGRCSLVTPFTIGRDAFSTSQKRLPAAFGPEVTVNGTNVSLDISDLLVGGVATLVFRLTNDDTDTGTSVQIVDYTIPGFGFGPTNGNSKFYVVDAGRESVFAYGTTGETDGSFIQTSTVHKCEE
ncbi:MAG: hypothetical protein R3C03_17680 [Pirellulaceae bacterium]